MDDYEHKTVQRLRRLNHSVERIEMGKVIEMKVKTTRAEFSAAFKKECDEWHAVSDELTPKYAKYGRDLTIEDVGNELTKRMAARGEKPLPLNRIWLTDPAWNGWLIPR